MFHNYYIKIRGFILSILKKQPRLYFLFYSIRYKIEIRKANQLIIVTTPGHVASSTTFKSLKTAKWGKSTRIYNFHSLNEGFNNKSPMKSISASHVLREVIKKKLKKGKLKNKKIVLITLVRDPIARALGRKFQHPDVYLKEVNHKALSKDEFPAACEKVKNHMINQGFLKETIDWQISFYEKELNEFWGIDFSKPFKHTEYGFMYHSNENIQFLLFSLEHFNEKFQEKMKYYLNKNVQIILFNTNVQRLPDNTFYSYCKKQLKFDKDLVNSVYEQPLLKRLYPSSMLSDFKDKWTS